MATPEKFRDKYRIRWTDHTGKRRCAVHDSHEAAKKALRAHEADADAIRAGSKPAPPVPHTFDQLCDYWLTNHAPEKRSRKDDESIIRRHLRPAFGEFDLPAIGAVQLDAFRQTKRELSPKTLANILTLLGSMLRLALDLGWLAVVPRVKKPKCPIDAASFAFLETQGQIDDFLRAAAAAGVDVFVLYATAIYTGMRSGELAALRWTDISLPRRMITVQRSHDGPTKNGRSRHVPIGNALLPILTQWRQQNPSPLVFPNRDGNQHAPSARIFQERLHMVLDAAGFAKPKTGRNIHALHFHSLRHTFASHWAMSGGDMWKLQRILGHQSIDMTMRYSHLCPSAFADDMDRLGPAPRVASGAGALPEHDRFRRKA
jgi:integrase